MTQPTQPTQSTQPKRERRMRLASISTGRVDAPIKVLVYGPGGVGKTTFAASAPAPIYLPTEDGTNQLDVQRFPKAETWADVLDAVDELAAATHDRKTLVVDTLTGIEPLIFRAACETNRWATIESPGFGKGEKVALDLWRQLQAKLEQLQAAKGMHVVLLGHSTVRKFQDPNPNIAGGSYDRYSLNVCANKDADAVAVWLNWTDAVLFADYETLKDDKRSRQAISTDARFCYTKRASSHDAKNRFSLPERLPLDWDAFWSGVQANSPASVEKLKTELAALLQWVAADVRVSALQAITDANNDARELARIHNKLSAMVEIKENGK